MLLRNPRKSLVSKLKEKSQVYTKKKIKKVKKYHLIYYSIRISMSQVGFWFDFLLRMRHDVK